MNVRRNLWKWIGMAICLNAAVALAEDEAPDKPGTGGVEVQSVVFGLVDEGSTNQPALARIAVAANSPQGKFWIGLICAAPSDALRAQLDLAADVGLLVEEISEASPAMKAGMQRHDLLLSATIPSKGEPDLSKEPDIRRLADVSDLIKAVQAAEKSSLKLEFLRRGRKQSLNLLPEERPQAQYNFNVVIGSDAEAVVVGNPYGLKSVQGNVSGIWAGPVLMNIDQPPLPKGMTIEFQPAEGTPEKVTVKKGDQTWSAEIKGLDKLPAEIGALVQQQLAVRSVRAIRATSAAHVANPGGVFAYSDGGIGAALPDDVTVTVVRKGPDPAKITLRKGDQTWDVTDKELDKLPAEVRPYAETVLRGQGHFRHTRIIQAQTAPATGSWGTPVPGTPIGLPGARPGIVTQYVPHPVHAIKPTVSSTATSTIRPTEAEELARQLKELTEQIEKLKQAVEKSQPKQ